MKKNYFLLFVCITLALNSCAPTMKQFVIQEKEALSEEETVVVLTLYDALPEGASKLGGFIYEEPTEKRLTFKTQLEYLKQKARSLGGNLVKLKEVASTTGNTFMLEVDLYYYDDAELLEPKDFHYEATQGKSNFIIYAQQSENLQEEKFNIEVNKIEKEVLTNDVLSFQSSAEVVNIKLGEEILSFSCEAGFTYYINISKNKASKPASLNLVNPLKARLDIEAYYFDESKENSFVFQPEKFNQLKSLVDYPETEKKNRREIKQKSVFFNSGITDRIFRLPVSRIPKRNVIKEDLEIGFYASIGGSYFIGKSHGVGITYQYNNNSTSASIENPITTNGLVLTDEYSVNRNLHYIGLYYHKRFFVFNHDELIFSFGPGFFFYDAINKDKTQSSKVSSSDFGAQFDVSYDFHLKSNLYLSLNGGCFFGRTKNISSTYRDSEMDNILSGRDGRNQGRFFLGAGLKYNF